ncbi:MAG TPA: hypothetical protein PLX30_08805 [Methanothrix sp.]|nr:hypothetical protein [Methanothrix sp.]
MKRILTWLLIPIILASQSALCENPVTLYLDDGTAENGFRMGDGRGHSVLFEAPSVDWNLSAALVHGKLEPEEASEIFVLEIWDEDLNTISKVTDRADSFFGEDFGWALVDVPDVQVSGPFLVSLYEFGGIYVGTDIGPATNRSFFSARNPNRILGWDLGLYQQNETEWMIRAVGFSPPPEVARLVILPDAASQKSSAKIEVEVRDPDQNLKSVTLHLAENDSQEVVWSEVQNVEGGEATVQFTWPGTFYRVSGPDGSVSPVLATGIDGVSERFQPLLARSAACILIMDRGDSMVPAYAYFGEDGRLNGLIDLSGQVHYVSRDFLNATSPDADYMDYLANDATAIEDESAIIFYKMIIPSGSSIPSYIYHQPIALSRSPLFNYRVSLEEVEAKAGGYVPTVVVEDRAYNAVQFAGSAEVKVI